MKNSGFEITGTKDMQDIFEQIAPKHARNLLRATVQGVASTIAKDAKKGAPKDSGDLRKAIKAKRKKSHPDKPMSVVKVEHGNNAKHDAFYWHFSEYGTTKQSETPYIRPAVDRARSNFESIMTQQFGKKLEALLKREAKKKAAK